MFDNLRMFAIPTGLLTFIIIISIAAVIAIVAFVIYRILMPKLKEDKPSDEEILNEELPFFPESFVSCTSETSLA